MRIDAKIQARQWILNAIQNHSCIPNKETEREIKRFISRLQRDIKQLSKAKKILKLAELKEEKRAKVEAKFERELLSRFEHAIQGD